MNAVTTIPTPRALDLFQLFDTLAALGSYSMVQLFDDFTPGCESALIAWAEAHGHAWTQRDAGPADGRFVVTTVALKHDGREGARITVQARRFS